MAEEGNPTDEENRYADAIASEPVFAKHNVCLLLLAQNSSARLQRGHFGISE